MESILEVKDLSVYYGVIQALKGISFHVDKGEIVALIGANGAGKTTTLHTLSGLIQANAGEINYNGINLRKTPNHKIVGMGMAQVPEGRRVFAEMTVLQNLKMGAFTRSSKAEMEETLASIYKRFPRLEERKNQLAGTLSGGEQQMLAVGRALMGRPKLLMMDEPSLGLAPIVVQGIFDIIRKIHEDGATVLLIEQNANMALHVADRAYVIENGKISMEGTGAELLEDEQVKAAYLGSAK